MLNNPAAISAVENFFGIDFSGAKDAGRHIWIARGSVEKGRLRIEDYRPAEAVLGHAGLRECMSALCQFIASHKDAAFGMDFPFGLPTSMVQEKTWEAFVLAFPRRYPGAEEFHHLCHQASDGKELKRICDKEARAPFSPYNRRVYRQTYYGIRDLLRPLVMQGRARGLPMQRAETGKPVLMEVCPSSALRRLGLPFRGCKGRTIAHLSVRKAILDGLEARTGLAIEGKALRSAVVANAAGDALDSVVAAYATFRAVSNPDSLIPSDNPYFRTEGHVYF